jgi:nicotinamidase-related amidase
MPQALVLIDLINELIAPEGKLSGKGYADFVERHGTLNRVATLLEHARNQGYRIIHVRVGFSPDYREQPR